MEFVVVVPTIRQDREGFTEAIASIESSFTLPTDFRVLDGEGGKVAALNRAYDDVLAPTSAPVYVTLDDDFVPPNGWQDNVAKALSHFPGVGVVCPWPGDAPMWLDYVGLESVGPWQEREGLRYRMLKPWRHIPGCLLAFRRECAVALGKMPESNRRYDIYEDCWRGRMAFKLGWRSMYVEAGECRFVPYTDSEEYLQEKAVAIDESRLEAGRVLAQFGLGDPWPWRLRRSIARLLGRAKPEANSARDGLKRRGQ